jgi:hypothetical protein
VLFESVRSGDGRSEFAEKQENTGIGPASACCGESASRRSAPREREGLFESWEWNDEWSGRYRVSRMRCSASGAKRCVADPGPPRTETVPGLQRIIALRFMLRCARDTRDGPTCGCTK